MATARISLDSPVFAGRLRTFDRRSTYERRAVLSPNARVIRDVKPEQAKKLSPARPNVATVKSTPKARPENLTPKRTSRSFVLKRELVHKPATRIRSKRRRGVLQKKITVAFAAVLFAFGAYVGVDGLRANQQVEAQVKNFQTQTQGDDSGSLAAAGDVPHEDDRPDVDGYKVGASLPRTITIPKLDVKARVLKLGATKEGALAAPANIYDTGWYDGSAKPGESGAMLIDGHVHGPNKPGIFVDLKKLKAGDEITIERGDGKTFTYEVVSTKTYNAEEVDMGAALSPVKSDKQGLNLITCAGEIDKKTNHYKDRLVVFAAQK